MFCEPRERVPRQGINEPGYSRARTGGSVPRYGHQHCGAGSAGTGRAGRVRWMPAYRAGQRSGPGRGASSIADEQPRTSCGGVRLGDRCGREDRHCMPASPIASYRTAHRFAVGHATRKNTAACATGQPSSTIKRDPQSLDGRQRGISVGHRGPPHARTITASRRNSTNVHGQCSYSSVPADTTLPARSARTDPVSPYSV